MRVTGRPDVRKHPSARSCPPNPPVLDTVLGREGRAADATGRRARCGHLYLAVRVSRRAGRAAPRRAFRAGGTGREGSRRRAATADHRLRQPDRKSAPLAERSRARRKTPASPCACCAQTPIPCASSQPSGCSTSSSARRARAIRRTTRAASSSSSLAQARAEARAAAIRRARPRRFELSAVLRDRQVDRCAPGRARRDPAVRARRGDVDIERVARPWSEQALRHAREALKTSAPDRPTVTPLRAPAAAPGLAPRATVRSAACWPTSASPRATRSKDVRHIELSLEGSGPELRARRRARRVAAESARAGRRRVATLGEARRRAEIAIDGERRAAARMAGRASASSRG